MKAKIPWDIERPGVYTLREWEIDPARSVLLILDMQRGYIHPAWGAGRTIEKGYPQIYNYYYTQLAAVVLPNVLRLQDFFRQHHLEVFYTRYGYQLPEGKDLPEWSWRRACLQQPPGTSHPLFQNGSPEYELAEELRPSGSELVLDKNSLNPFNSTPMDQVMRNMELENILIAGVLTNGAVESTARSAADRGYNVVVVGDACAAYTREDHENPLRFTNGYVVKTTEEILRLFTPLLKLP